jgi:uncharacterized protein
MPQRQARDQLPARASGRVDAGVDEGLRAYMLGVYNLMMIGVALSAAVTLFIVTAPEHIQALFFNRPALLMVFVGTFALSYFSDQIMESESALLGHLFFWPYCILWGIGLAPAIDYAVEIDHPEIVARAFFVATSMFAAASIYGYATRGDLCGFGPVLCMLSCGLCVASLLNFVIFKSGGFCIILCYATVIVFTAITAWETQMIKQHYHAGDSAEATGRKSIFGAFQLYGSFIMIFSRLLHIYLRAQVED